MLDRYYGMFSGIGAAALQESWKEFIQMEAQSERNKLIQQQIIDDAEFNDLLDHYEHELRQKKRLKAVISNLEDELGLLENSFKQMKEEIHQLRQQNANLNYTNQNLNDNLNTVKSDLLKANNEKKNLLSRALNAEFQCMSIKTDFANLQQKHSNQVNESNQTKDKIKSSYDLTVKIQTNTEQTFTMQYSKINTEKFEAQMCLKLAYTQNIVLKRILTKLIADGRFNPKDYSLEENIVLKQEDAKDFKRQGITFSECHDWISTHHPEKISTILGFNP